MGYKDGTVLVSDCGYGLGLGHFSDGRQPGLANEVPSQFLTLTETVIRYVQLAPRIGPSPSKTVLALALQRRPSEW